MRIRYRHFFMALGSVAVLAGLLITDPDAGRLTGLEVLDLVRGLLVVAVVHYARKAFFDYPEADARPLFSKASGSSVGSGLAIVGIAIVTHGLLGLFTPAKAQDVRTFVPPAAAKHLPTVAAEIERVWPAHPYPAYFGGLIEHESCVSLKSPRCWSERSSLRGLRGDGWREEGAGLGQITRVYRGDVARLDSLTDMRSRHPELAELTWSNVYDRPDLQIRAILLMSAGNWRSLHDVGDPVERLWMTDVSYNRGRAGLQRERRACAMSRGCDPDRWLGHVELHCAASRRPIYSGRSACDISRRHPVDVITVRSPKYVPALGGWRQ